MLTMMVAMLAMAEPPPPPRDIYFRGRHYGLFAVSMTAATATVVERLNLREPKWYTPGRFDLAARDALKAPTEPGETNTAAARTSDVLVFGVAPAVVIGSTLAWGLTAPVDGRRAKAKLIFEDLAVVGEAFALSFTTVNVLKVTVGRRRPFVWSGAEADPAVVVPYDEEKDQNASFPSGHAASAFSIAVSGATIASMRRYKHWRLAWLGLIPATAVPFLRVVADKHYMSDVLVGTAIGTAFGVAIPLLVHNPRLRTLKVTPAGRGAQLSLAF